MSGTTTSTPAFGHGRPSNGLRFGRESIVAGDRALQWLSARRSSSSPRRLLACFAALSLVSFVIALGFWIEGATLVMPFAWLEAGALGVALLVHARHAADRECIRLEGNRLTVEHACGRRTERVEFAPAWVRVEPESGERSLVELSGQGRRIAIGRFVRPELRRQLAEELRGALRRWPMAAGGSNEARI